MSRQIHLAAHLSVAALEQRYRAAYEPHERTWWQILWLLAKGQKRRAIAASTGYTRAWIGQIAKRYQARQRAGAKRDAQSAAHDVVARAAHALSGAAGGQEELRQALAGPAPAGAKYWRARDVADGMAAQLGRPVATQRGWDYRQRLQDRKQSRQAPRPQHALADPEQQDTCKKRCGRLSRQSPPRFPTPELKSGPPTSIGSA